MIEQRQQSEMRVVTSPPPLPAWRLHAEGGHAELSTRHWFWGRRVLEVTTTAGQISDMSEADPRLALQLQIIRDNGAAVTGSVRAHRFMPVGYGRFEATAEIEVDRRTAKGELRLHDYGAADGGQGGMRRFATISMRIGREFVTQADWSWPRMLIGAHADLYAELEWREQSLDSP